MGGVRLGVVGDPRFRGKRIATAVCGVVTVRAGGVVVPLVEVLATRAFTFCTVGVAKVGTFSGGRFKGSSDCLGKAMVLEEDSLAVKEALLLTYAGIEVLKVNPRSLPFKLEIGGVLGTDWDGRGGGGDLYRGLGFGLPRGLLPLLFGDVLRGTTLADRLFSLNAFGMGGTGGTPFCPPTTTRDFLFEDLLVASR